MQFVRGKNSNFRHSVMMPSKGLLNNPGENNCFMNSAVQVLWHLDVFRRSFRLLEGHGCLEECCIFCALKEIFGKFEASSEDALPPDVLRIAMAKTFQDQRKFQIGRMDDAAEFLETILLRLHYHIAYEEAEDICNASHCITHQKFAMHIKEKTFCKCGATSEPMNFYQIVSYVSASALVTCESDGNGSLPYKSFGELLKATLSMGAKITCPNDKCCVYKDRTPPRTKMHKTLLNSPDIACIGIIWDTDRPHADNINKLLNCLGKKLELRNVFDYVSDDKAKKTKLRLVGIMTYYGKHYTTFFFNTKQKSWFYFDDDKVKEIGEDWELVKAKCRRERFQPLLALYANPEGEAIDNSKVSKAKRIFTENELQEYHRQSSEDPEQAAVMEQQKRSMKRMSFKKIVGSAFRKGRKKPKNYKINHHADMILGINGRQMKETINIDQSGKIYENKSFIDEYDNTDVGNAGNGSDVDCDSYRFDRKGKISRDLKESYVSNKSPNHKDGKASNFANAQADILLKHRRNISNIELFSDRKGDSSDYDNLDSPRSLKDVRKMSIGHHAVSLEEEVFAQSAYSRTRLEDKPALGQARGEFDNFMNDAEEILDCSFTAERDGYLIKAFHCCTEANRRYREALEMDGLNKSMKKFADERRWLTHERSIHLNIKIEQQGETSSSIGYLARGVSKTSDYESLSDNSGGPRTPDYSSKVTPNGYDSNQVVHQDNQQTKLKKSRKVCESRRSPDGKGYVEDNNQRIDLKPSSTEIEQLSALLQDFGVHHDVAVKQDIHNGNAEMHSKVQLPNKQDSMEGGLSQHTTVLKRKAEPARKFVIINAKSVPLNSCNFDSDTRPQETQGNSMFTDHTHNQEVIERADEFDKDEERLQMTTSPEFQESGKKPDIVSNSNTRRNDEFDENEMKFQVSRSNCLSNDKFEEKETKSQFLPGIKSRNGEFQRNAMKSPITPGPNTEVDYDHGNVRTELEPTVGLPQRNTNEEDNVYISDNQQPKSISSTSSCTYNIVKVDSNLSRKMNNDISEHKELSRDDKDYTHRENDNFKQNVHVSKMETDKLVKVGGTERMPTNENLQPSVSSKPEIVTAHVTARYHVYKPQQIRSSITINRQVNKWPCLDANFSNNPRQMCQQCGTVTVKKPKKFCSRCQSDYL
eukprot:gene12192-13448_t